jgi:hypothetical protein
LHKTLALLAQVELAVVAVFLVTEMFMQAAVVQVLHLKQVAQVVVAQVLALV